MNAASVPRLLAAGTSPRTSGLRLLPREPRAAMMAGAVSIVGVTLFILLLDGLLFNGRLDPTYVAIYSAPLLPRTLLAMRGSLVEEVIFRLFIMTALSVGLRRLTTLRPILVAALAIGLSQLINIWPLLLAMPLYASFRFWLVGSVWGYLYWRHGWVTAAAAHPLCHLLLDPSLRLVLLLTA